MHSLSNKIFILIFLLTGIVLANSDTLYTCDFNGKSATYHENEAKRMILLGASCREMNSIEYVTCAMNGVRLDYSYAEAQDLLYRHPEAHCEMNHKLFVAGASSRQGLSMEAKSIIYFPVNSTSLSYESLRKIAIFARQHRNMGYTYTITGYASATGNASKNHMLSLHRAGAVRSALLNNGVQSDRILSVDALGEASLRYNTPYEFSLNRAVVIKAYK